jgi:hypothetical protein
MYPHALPVRGAQGLVHSPDIDAGMLAARRDLPTIVRMARQGAFDPLAICCSAVARKRCGRRIGTLFCLAG